MAIRWALEVHFELFWVLVARVSLRWPLGTHFVLFSALEAKWLPGGF